MKAAPDDHGLGQLDQIRYSVAQAREDFSIIPNTNSGGH